MLACTAKALLQAGTTWKVQDQPKGQYGHVGLQSQQLREAEAGGHELEAGLAT